MTITMTKTEAEIFVAGFCFVLFIMFLLISKAGDWR